MEMKRSASHLDEDDIKPEISSTPKRSRRTPAYLTPFSSIPNQNDQSLPTPPLTVSKSRSFTPFDLDLETPKPKATTKAKAKAKAPQNGIISPAKLKKINAIGTTPYPKWGRPTPEECQKIVDLLSAGNNHGPIVPPSELVDSTLATCGEVPLVLDGLFRTILSQSTTAHNATLGKRAMDAKYGRANFDAILSEGTQADLARTINCTGLGDKKAEYIFGVLETLKRERGELSLEYLRQVSTYEAMKELTRFNGVGVKTASCICLFTLGRPSFAVDTHVHRISKSLGWAPDTSSADDAFLHLDALIPDHLKYALHSLFVHHGRSCRKCSSNDVITLEECEVCFIDELVVRKERKRKGKKVAVPGNRGKKEEEEEGAGLLGYNKELVEELKDEEGALGMIKPEEREDQDERKFWESRARSASPSGRGREHLPEASGSGSASGGRGRGVTRSAVKHIKAEM